MCACCKQLHNLSPDRHAQDPEVKAAFVVLQHLWNKEYEVRLVTAAAVAVRPSHCTTDKGSADRIRACCRASGQRFQGMRGNQQPCRW
jgi:hypothetical protein